VAYEFKLPDLGEGLTEGEIARWLVTEGQEVAEDEPLVEILTDKTTVEIPSPAAGVVSRLLAQEGEVVPVGTVIVVIGDGAVSDAAASETARESGSPPAPPTSLKQAAGRVQATPLVRRMAQQLGVELESVTGTGPNGRITEEDLRSAAGSGAPGAEGRRGKWRRSRGWRNATSAASSASGSSRLCSARARCHCVSSPN
jgi:pyruvate dehydrogenase E2 component (dihydrolipoamide acetyltransferase)